MSDLKVTRAGEVGWFFEPRNSGRGGDLTIDIAVDTAEKRSKIWLVIELDDNRPSARRPPPDSGDPPYRYDVDTRRHRKLEAESGETDSVHFGPSRSTPRVERWVETTTIKVALHVLRGIRVLPLLKVPGEGEVNFEPRRQSFGRLTVDISVIVVEDETMLPEPGLAVESRRLFPMLTFESEALGRTPLMRGVSGIVARYRPNAIEFTWMATRQILTVALVDPFDGSSGFVFAVNPEPRLRRSGSDRLYYDDLLHIRVCGKVKITLSRIPHPVRGYADRDQARAEELHYLHQFIDPVAWAEAGYPDFSGTVTVMERGGFGVSSKVQKVGFVPREGIHRPLAEALFFRIERVRTLEDLGAPQDAFLVDPEDDVARRDYRTYYVVRPVPAMLRLAIDLGIGFIPLVGDVVDFAEFNYALATGKDRWGQDVDGWQLVLMGIAVIPLVGDLAKLGRPARRLLQ